MNPLYQQMMPNNNNMMQQFQQFRNSFNGNPQQAVQNLLNSGRISQAQYNDAVNKANQLARMIGMK